MSLILHLPPFVSYMKEALSGFEEKNSINRQSNGKMGNFFSLTHVNQLNHSIKRGVSIREYLVLVSSGI